MTKLSRSQLWRKRRLPPKPEPPEDGIYIYVPGEGEVFASWGELEQATQEVMECDDVELTGKPTWDEDETYNLRRKK